MNEKIRLATTDPLLKDKIKVDLEGELKTIYWYIKFNIPLDENTVSEETMRVTDTKGYIMKTNIKYYEDRNTIIVSPFDSYMENVYYVLSISKKVKSKSGKNLKRDTHILFKLKDNQISEYELLKSTVKIPKPEARPENYDEIMIETYPDAVLKKVHTKVYEKKIKSATKKIKRQNTPKLPKLLPKAENGNPHEKINAVLRYKDIDIDILISLAGIILLAISFYFNIILLMGISVVICIIGVIHMLSQMLKKNALFAMRYNRGVTNYNKGRYDKALKHFSKALEMEPNDRKLDRIIAKTEDKIFGRD
ncbi:MAG: tetratricopeptide repeat protein [Lachnospiraceae bacterium]|nr:tetratricopeptide repeat protein [Lachnospiraceae bacterium]